MDAFCGMSVRGHLATERVRRLDDDLQLRIGEMRADASACIARHAASDHDLDQIGAAADDVTHRALTALDARAQAWMIEERKEIFAIASAHITMTADGGDDVARRLHARARHEPFLKR